ncbi:MAG TPA: hypothetical protein VNE16_08470 [Vicinamibacterales bacterium]|nr:hypothetical protein [Vicinamibacterales bacterium]
MPSPHDDYLDRLARRRGEVARFDRLDARLAAGRLAVAALGAAGAWLVFGRHALSAGWLGVPVVAFIALAVRHNRVIADRTDVREAVRFYERGLARLEDRWAGTGSTGVRFLEDHHLYARDLDLFGEGSLFELLSTATTPTGEATLAGWLCHPADPREIAGRQAAVAELRPNLALREDLVVAGAGAVAPEAPGLGDWGGRPPLLTSRAARALAALLAATTVVTFAGWMAAGWGSAPLVGALLVEALFAAGFRRRVHLVLADLEPAARHLERLARLLARLERERFTGDRLVALQRRLDTDHRPPSVRIGQLTRLVALVDSQKNQFFAPFAAALLWSTQLAFAVDAWRRRAGPGIADWLAVAGEFEALCALAGYSFEHPADPFPELVEAGPIFDGEALGHPLIAGARCTRNDVRLGGGAPQVLLVSGSNMSGKSTLLRTVGVAAVLALAGAPVRAARLRISPLAIGATLRIEDSLQAGRSRFYAEITRLRELVDLGRGPRPLLFLLDEIFHGTNSHDRRLGADAVVRSLAGLGGIGLVTTHDLALTALADTAGGAVANVHFEDQFEAGRMTFDYRLRPGVVQHSNALALMRAVGLPV